MHLIVCYMKEAKKVEEIRICGRRDSSRLEEVDKYVDNRRMAREWLMCDGPKVQV